MAAWCCDAIERFYPYLLLDLSVFGEDVLPAAYLPVFFTQQAQAWGGSAGDASCSKIRTEERQS